MLNGERSVRRGWMVVSDDNLENRVEEVAVEKGSWPGVWLLREHTGCGFLTRLYLYEHTPQSEGFAGQMGKAFVFFERGRAYEYALGLQRERVAAIGANIAALEQQAAAAARR